GSGSQGEGSADRIPRSDERPLRRPDRRPDAGRVGRRAGSPPRPGGHALRRLISIEHANLWMLCIWLGFVVLALVVNAPAMGRFDLKMTTRIQRHHGALRDWLATGATFLRNTGTLLALGVVVCGSLLSVSRPWAALFSALGLLGMPISGGIKHLVRRQRPQSEIARVVLPVV